jgi:hypothetical protein
MKPDHIQFWKKTFNSCEQFMAPKHKLWRRLIKQYKMEYQIHGMKKARVPKISRFYPLTRMILTSTMFNTPKVLMRVEQEADELTTEILQRVGNQTLELTKSKQEVQQAGFDALYCYYGWLKYGVNPKKDEDVIAPYVANDTLQNGMVFVQRVSPFNVYPDPQCAPHDISHARFIWEKMLVPLEFVKKDKRYKQSLVSKLKPISKEEVDEGMLENAQEGAFDGDESEAAWRDSQMEGNYVLLREVHDRTHKQLYTFAQGIDEPIEERPHPFLAGILEERPDPLTGEQKLTGEFTPTGGYLVEGGFPYGALTFDLSHDELYGIPMMGYAEDSQKGIVESLARRRGLLKRGTRVILGNKAERQENINLGEDIEEGKDLSIAWVNDVHNAFSELQQGNPPPDQMGYESDMRQYEEQTLSVSQLQAGGGPRRTATEASLMASFGQLNREWMQSKVGDLYEQMVTNFLRIMSDRRYTPENFLINVARDENEPIFEAVQADLMGVRFKVHIEVGSMKPMFEELEKEDALALGNYMLQFPEIPRAESIKHVLKTFRVPNIERFIGSTVRFDAMRAAMSENQLIIFSVQAGQPTPIKAHPQDDHQGHMQAHDMQQFSQFQGFQVLSDIQKQQAAQLNQAHMQEHQQMLQQAAAAPGAKTGNINSTGSRAASGSPEGIVGKVDSAVRSNAQVMSQPTVLADRGQN